MTIKKNKKLNCWEFKECGRESGGKNVDEFGICPSTQSGKDNSLNSGKLRGRVCWSVAGTFCDGEVQGSFAKKTKTCYECSFYKKVLKEEGDNFEMLLPMYDL